MSDLEGAVRELLSRRAAAQPPILGMPRSVGRRVRRRLAWNSVALGASLMVLTVGVVVGLRVMGPTAPEQPGGGGGSAPTPCPAGSLQATMTLEGAAGSREGAIRLTNISQRGCTLEGTPPVVPLDERGAPIVRGVTFQTTQAGWVVDGSPRPIGWPVVTLDPGASGLVRMRWSNWCPDGRPAPGWRLTIADGAALPVEADPALSPPPCNGPGLDSTVEIGPFEPDGA